MPVLNPFETVSVRELDCHGEAVVTLGFTAAPQLLNTPADIVLALDCSDSCTDQCMALMKAGIHTLIDTVCAASGGKAGHSTGHGTRLALVRHGGCAKTVVPLRTGVEQLHRAVNELTAAGEADLCSALIRSQALLGPCRNRRRVVVNYVCDPCRIGGDPSLIAQSCMDTGTELFCITPSPTWLCMKHWVSSPVEQHLFTACSCEQLPELFSRMGAQLVRAGVLDAVLEEEIHHDFEITHIEAVENGTVECLSPYAFRWTPNTAGLLEKETLRLRFAIRHTGDTDGVFPVNRCLRYRDQWGSCLHFPSPRLRVHCGCGPVCPEPCPPTANVPMCPCQDCTVLDMEDVSVNALGRIVYLNMTLKKVCPGKRVALAVVLSEVDRCGTEHNRGMKVFTIPAQDGTECRDIALKCIRFVVPEDPDCNCGCCGCCCPPSLCKPRCFRARVYSNYLDTDFIPCCGEASL